MRIVLVRHGETFWNRSGVIHGQYDIPLNSTGISQAKHTADKLKDFIFDACFCSPLTRAIQTANQILYFHKNVKIEFDSRLKEICVGDLEGAKSCTSNVWEDNGHNYNVETQLDFYSRVVSFIEELKSNFNNNSTILIVTHSGVIRMFNCYFYPEKYKLFDDFRKFKFCNSQYQVIDLGGFDDMKIGLYPMVADVLHTGHIIALEEAKKHCDYLIVALHCCPNYKQPIQSIYERFIQLRSVKWVDEIIPYTDVDDAKNMLLSLDYNVYFLGEDHKGSNWECCDVIDELGKEVIYLSRKHPFSSTYLKDRISIENGKKLKNAVCENKARMNVQEV